MKIYLIRHGETEYSKKEYTAGHVDIPLNETGREKAQSTAEFLKGKGFTKIFTSSLSRAKQTALIIGDVLNLQVIECDELREHTSGNLDGVPLKKFFEALKKAGSFDEMVKQAGGEPWNNFKDRVWNKFHKIVGESAENGENSILIVTHGGVSRLIFSEILGCSVVKHVSQGNCCINIINYDQQRDDHFRIDLINSTFHLN